MKIKHLVILMLAQVSLVLNAQDKTNMLAIESASTDIFTQPYERTFNVYSIGLGYKGPKTALYGFYNAGQLLQTVNDSLTTSLEDQFELDFYHRLTKTTSYWLNYAYSSDVHFPEHRAMARVWQDVGYGFLISGGTRYFRTQDDLDIWMANAGIEKYAGRFWFEALGHFLFKEPGTRYAYQFNTRVFWQDANFIELSLMTGAAPDEPWRNQFSNPNLTAHFARLSICTYLGKSKTLQLRAGAGYYYEEYQQDLWRNRYVGNISLTYKMF
jgi:YaiO family outer membrane protein